MAFFAVILGFALIWRIEWLAAAGLVGAVAVALREFWKTDREESVPAQEVEAFEQANSVAARALAHIANPDTRWAIEPERDRVPVAGGES
jgi:hypothetical protein